MKFVKVKLWKITSAWKILERQNIILWNSISVAKIFAIHKSFEFLLKFKIWLDNF